ncbi:MAG: alkaline phosphatase family protein [Acidobacteriota bacterium]
MALGFAYFALLLGFAGTLLLVPAFRGRSDRARRALPTLLTAVMVVSAILFWVHASYFSFYLPPGINTRLLKAASWLTLAATLCFYTLVLHRLRRRPFGRRSRALFVILALAAVYVVVERREAFRQGGGPGPRATAFESRARPQLLVVGIETATLDVVLPLAEQGRLPFMNEILDSGVYGRLRSLSPTRRSSLWTTLTTGKFPYRHGVVGDRLYEGYLGRRDGPWLRLLPLGLESWGDWVSSRRVGAGDVEALQIWQVFSRLGLPTALVGWPLSSPPSPELGAVLPDRFFSPDGDGEAKVRPAELAERAKLFRTRLGELDPEIVSRFGESPPDQVLDALVNDLWREDLAIFLLDGEPSVDALFVLLPGLGGISRQYFGGFSAVQFRGVQEPESVDASRLVAAYYEHLDAALARLWDSMREPRLLVVASAHGVSDQSLAAEVGRLVLRRPPSRGDIGGGPDGLIMARGEGIGPREDAVVDAQLVDLVPTLLYGLGFPVARDLDGLVLTGLFDTTFVARRPLSFVPSYETLAPPPEPEP